jgi:hypothetical protein
MHRLSRLSDLQSERTAWVLDDVWPETASVLESSFGEHDQLLAPGIFGGRPRRYRWPVSCRHAAPMATARRHFAMRWVKSASGAVRQRTYLEQDRELARRLGGEIDYRATHLVVAQAWLPWLDEIGTLGGRTFDVVMSRYPFAEIHRILNGAAAELEGSATIADFRADQELVEREFDLLLRARRIYTPHHGVAGLFPGRAVVLAWHKPPAAPRKAGTRTAFLGPTIARQRPDLARGLAAQLDEPLIVFGPVLESLWRGLEIERREMGSAWLDDIGSIIHPAAITHQPRSLLEAQANGVAIYATETCGLDRSDFLPLEEFRAAIRTETAAQSPE